MTGRGRPTRNTAQVKVMLTNNVLSELRSSKPELMKPGSTTFRHGKLAAYIEGLLWKDLRGKPKYVSSQIVSASMGRGQSGEQDGGGDFPRSTLSMDAADSSRHGVTGGIMGGAEDSDEEVREERE